MADAGRAGQRAMAARWATSKEEGVCGSGSYRHLANWAEIGLRKLGRFSHSLNIGPQANYLVLRFPHQ